MVRGSRSGCGRSRESSCKGRLIMSSLNRPLGSRVNLNALVAGLTSGLAFSPAFSKNFLLTDSELENFLTGGAVPAGFSVPAAPDAEDADGAGLARAAALAAAEGAAELEVAPAAAASARSLAPPVKLGGGGVPDVTDTAGDSDGDGRPSGCGSSALLAAAGFDGFGSTRTGAIGAVAGPAAASTMAAAGVCAAVLTLLSACAVAPSEAVSPATAGRGKPSSPAVAATPNSTTAGAFSPSCCAATFDSNPSACSPGAASPA